MNCIAATTDCRLLRMTEESSSHLSVVMTTSDVDQSWTSTVSSSSPLRGVDFYFQCAVAVIGFVGAAANAFVLCGLVASKQHRKLVLIFNQNVLDLCSCLLLVVTYALKLGNIRLVGSRGYWLCIFLFSDNLVWCSMNASVINLASITVERYLKVVHPSWSKKWLRRWLIYAAVAFAWISGTVYNMALAFSTSTVIDGVCYAYVFWKRRLP